MKTHSLVKRLAPVGLAIVVTTAVLSACADEESGSPVLQGGKSSGVNSTGQETPQRDVFSGLEACNLMEPVTSKEGYDSGTNEDMPGSVSGCMAEHPDGGVVSFHLRDRSIEELPSDFGPVTDTRVAGRAAKKREGPELCTIAIKVTDNARADIGSKVRIEDGDPCGEISEMAEEITPSLPQG